MIALYNGDAQTVRMTIYRGTTCRREDLSRADVKVFLIGGNDKKYLDHEVKDNMIYVTIPEGMAPDAYSIQVVWAKNRQSLKRMHINSSAYNMAYVENAFCITEHADEATNLASGQVVDIKTKVATYGYDGLNSYEMAVVRGDWSGTESEWLQHQRYVSVLNETGDSETDTMSQKAITKALKGVDESILDEISQMGRSIEETQNAVTIIGRQANERIDEVEKAKAGIVDISKVQSFVYKGQSIVWGALPCHIRYIYDVDGKLGTPGDYYMAVCYMHKGKKGTSYWLFYEGDMDDDGHYAYEKQAQYDSTNVPAFILECFGEDYVSNERMEAFEKQIASFANAVKIPSWFTDDEIGKAIEKATDNGGYNLVLFFDDSDEVNSMFGCQDIMVGSWRRWDNQISLQMSCFDGRVKLQLAKQNGVWVRQNILVRSFD